MKLCVSITFEVDPTEYHMAKDTPRGAIKLTKEILRNRADWPDSMVTITCQDASESVNLQ